MSPEMRYLAELVRSYTGGTDPRPPVEDLDRDRLKRLVTTHRVATALASRVEDESLIELSRNLRRRTALMMLELAALLPGLEEAGCEPLVLKGAALANTVYRDPGERVMTDLDILVRRPVLDRALERLSSAGYGPMPTTRHPRFYERHHFHRILANRSGVLVELHWDLAKPADYFRFDVDALYARSRVVPLEAASMRIPSLEDQVLHAASQSIDEGFSNLWRVLDTALVIRTGGLDGARLAALAREQRLGTAVWLLAETVRELSRVGPVDGIDDGLTPSAGIRRSLLGLRIPDRLLELFTLRHPGHKLLLRWLCAPDLSTAAAELKSFVFPNEARLMSRGFGPGERPGLATRTGMTARNAWSTTKALGYLCWRFAAHGR